MELTENMASARNENGYEAAAAATAVAYTVKRTYAMCPSHFDINVFNSEHFMHCTSARRQQQQQQLLYYRHHMNRMRNSH